MVVRVGDRVLVEGTSKWWPGGNYLAVVADVGLDGSVKVRYADGGFKRFSRADFGGSAPAQAHHEALEEADSAASGDDVIALEEEEPRLKRRASVNAAAATEARRQRESLRLEREALDDAIRRRDFLRAHSIDSRVRRSRPRPPTRLAAFRTSCARACAARWAAASPAPPPWACRSSR